MLFLQRDTLSLNEKLLDESIVVASCCPVRNVFVTEKKILKINSFHI